MYPARPLESLRHHLEVRLRVLADRAGSHGLFALVGEAAVPAAPLNLALLGEYLPALEARPAASGSGFDVLVQPISVDITFGMAALETIRGIRKVIFLEHILLVA